jgi:GNAT superfamily N-acetyltransferase
MAFGTKLEPWLPDHESLWGRRLKWFLDPIRDITIRVPQGFSFAALDGRSNLPGPLLRIQERRWPLAFGTATYQHVFSMLTQNPDTPRALRVHIKHNLDVKYCIVINRGTTPVAVARRVIWLSRRLAFHDMLRVNPDCQGDGLASQLLANAIPLYRLLDIKGIRLNAGLTAGGAVWPKFEAWRQTHAQIRRNLRDLDPHFQTACLPIFLARSRKLLNRLCLPQTQRLSGISPISTPEHLRFDPPVTAWDHTY